MQAATQVLEHAGVRNPAPVTEDMVAAAKGLSGARFRAGASDPDVSKLLPQLRELFAGPEAELTRLINEHWPGHGFKGVPHEPLG